MDWGNRIVFQVCSEARVKQLHEGERWTQPQRGRTKVKKTDEFFAGFRMYINNDL